MPDHNTLFSLSITAPAYCLQNLQDFSENSNIEEDLLLPIGWQHSLSFVVASQPMDSAFNQNQAELGIFILEKKVTLQPNTALSSQ